MKKNMILALLVAMLAIMPAAAEFGLGGSLSGLYSPAATMEEMLARLLSGDGIFHGMFVEIGGKYTTFGASFAWSNLLPGIGGNPFRDADRMMYIQGHLVGYKAMLDPFIEVGFGRLTRDYANYIDDPDPFQPLTATRYLAGGGGLGLTAGRLNIFTKILYLVPAGQVTGWNGYPLEPYMTAPTLKVLAGAKLVF
ncbi:MAG: hypothetical protein WHT81_08770 [Rectinemataceae bacterium]|nr:hypothetical protein [Spirochaetaceae bacterium]